MPLKIEHDAEKCIGCGSCAAVCPDNWVMEEDKAKPKETEMEDTGCNQQAADACPVQCIRLVNE